MNLGILGSAGVGGSKGGDVLGDLRELWGVLLFMINVLHDIRHNSGASVLYMGSCRICIINCREDSVNSYLPTLNHRPLTTWQRPEKKPDLTQLFSELLLEKQGQ